MTETVIERREIGTVTVQVVHFPELGKYALALSDRFGIAGSIAVRGIPCEKFLEQIAAHHSRISQSVTRRN